MILRLFLTGLCLFSLLGTGNAQDGELDTYVPPPMFGAPRAVDGDSAYKNSKTPDEPSAPAKTIQPKIKKPVEKKKSNKLYIPPAEKIYDAKPIIKPIVKEKPKAVPKLKVKAKPKPKPKPKAKIKPKVKVPVVPKKTPRVEPLVEMLEIVPEATPVVAKQEVKPAVEAPIEKLAHPKEIFTGEPLEKALKKEEVKTQKPSLEPSLEPIDFIQKNRPKPTSQGIVKGPKTMPAYKKQGVESEVLYAPETKKPATLIDRVQQKFLKKKEKEEPKNIVIKPSPDFVLPQFNVLADGSRKLNVTFKAQEKTLNNNHLYAANEMIVPLMRQNSRMRLRLESYASLQEGSLSGDRRVALSRVMDLRGFLLENDIEASRIDVRSLGADTESQAEAMDRIEIYIVQ